MIKEVKYKKTILLIISLLCLIIYIKHIYKSQEYFEAINNKKPETVIVLHGISKDNKITYLLSKRLAESGFEVHNISYPYRNKTIQEISDFLHEKIIDLGIDKKEKLNFVGHSMGGLIIRNYIHKYKPENLNRVVMVATPNHGSELADKMKNWKIYDLKFGKASSMQLGTDQYNLDDAFGDVNYELGIIAGKTWLNPIFSYILPGKDDGIVSIESTKLNGMKEHDILNFPHTTGIMRKKVAKNVINFLKNGTFK